LTSNSHYTNGMIDEFPEFRYIKICREKLLYWAWGEIVSLNECQSEE